MMGPDDRKEFSNIIQGLLRHYHKTPNKQILNAYWKVLKHLTLPNLEQTIERIYTDAPRGLPGAYDIANLARGRSRPTMQLHVKSDTSQARLLEIAALRNRLRGDNEDYGVKLMAIHRGPDHDQCYGLTPVSELCDADARLWLDRFEHDAREQANNPQDDKAAEDERRKRYQRMLDAIAGGAS